VTKNNNNKTGSSEGEMFGEIGFKILYLKMKNVMLISKVYTCLGDEMLPSQWKQRTSILGTVPKFKLKNIFLCAFRNGSVLSFFKSAWNPHLFLYLMWPISREEKILFSEKPVLKFWTLKSYAVKAFEV
jgi:hypothetical protein